MSRLVAIRRAAWPLHYGLIRPPELQRLASAIDQLDAERESMSKQIVAALHAAIPRVVQQSSRARLLKLKRDVHNLRPVDVVWTELHAIDSGLLSKAFRRYVEACSRRCDLLEAAEKCAETESRRQLLPLIERESYQLALQASSESLAARLRGGGATLENTSERDLRSFYAYICRFATKANPLHLFACISLDDGEGSRADGACEVIFDVEALLRIDAQALAVTRDKTRIRLQKRPLVRTANGWEAWIKSASGGLAIARIRNAPILDAVSDIFRTRAEVGARPTLTVAEFEEALSAHLPAQGNVEEVTQSLLRLGIIVPYLCDDLRSPGRFLQGLDPLHDRIATVIERWHLARVDAGELKQLDEEVRRAGSSSSHGGSMTYHVNTYSQEDMVRGRSAAAEVARELQDLKRVFLLTNNFARGLQRNREFLCTVLSGCQVRSYLDVLKLSLRSVGKEHDPSTAASPASDPDRISSQARSLSGQLAHGQLASLTPSGTPTDDEATLCYVGAFDFRARTFYINNIFTGDGRFTGRYFKGGELVAEATRGDCIDVEIAMPGEHSLNFVRRRFDTGFGFDSRWASAYRRWIEPEQILVRMVDDRPIFCDAVSGRRLRFHYRGGLLATLIPHEYQLLLQDHADFYRNIFSVPNEQHAPSPIEHRPALSYGRVCLRRESWRVAGAELSTRVGRLGVQEWLALRHWVYESLDVADLWYYRIISAGRTSKPFFMDISSLQSVRAFRHALRRSAGRSVELSKMAPEMSGMWQVGGCAYVAELMIEV